MKKYPSKISYGLLIFLFIVFFSPFIYEFINNGISGKLIPALGVILLPLAFILHLLFKTEYTIDKTNLNIKCSFVINTNIDIKKIKEISKTKSIISSPAPSIDRIKIKYGESDEIIISPKNKMNFAKDLTNINPEIINKITED
jgi:hypothetical protein